MVSNTILDFGLGLRVEPVVKAQVWRRTHPSRIFSARGMGAVHDEPSGEPSKRNKSTSFALAFCLHLEVAQVGISWNFVQ